MTPLPETRRLLGLIGLKTVPEQTPLGVGWRSAARTSGDVPELRAGPADPTTITMRSSSASVNRRLVRFVTAPSVYPSRAQIIGRKAKGPAAAGDRAHRSSVPRRLTDVPELLQVLRGGVLRGLLVDLDLRVQFLHHLEREVALDILHGLAEVGTGLVHHVLAGDEADVTRGEHAKVVFQNRVLVAVRAEIRVGRKQDRQVRVALVEHLVAKPDVDRRKRLEVQPVVLLEPDQTVDP